MTYNIFIKILEKVLSMRELENIISMRERFIFKLKNATIFDNFFMRVVFENKEVCEYVLRKLLKKPDLIVIDCKTEVQISKLFGRDSRLDVLATDKSRKMFNIEIQKEKEEFHELRVRYYHSAIDSEIIQKGKKYSELPPVYLIYISKKDIWKKGATIYTIEKKLKYHNKFDIYDDKQYTLYVNAEIKDTTEQEISALMDYFQTCNPADTSQGVLSEYIHYLKNDEKGNNSMYDEFTKEFEEDIRKRTKADDIAKIMLDFKVSFERALKTLDIPQEEHDVYAELLHYFYPNVMQQ